MRENHRLVGISQAIRALDEEIDYAARSNARVLLTGESGCGKEVAARLIHARSVRARNPLVTINCAGFPDSLLESELFGHVRGSFTGAERDRAGLLEVAHRGTLFMDEVAEMSLRMQAVLLRVLDTGEVERVGSDRPGPRVDVRIIAATNKNLGAAVNATEFRADLQYRLNVVHLQIPPLRDRREDVPHLVEWFLSSSGPRHGTGRLQVAPDAMEKLVAYDWPGNVRELKNVVEQIVVLGRKPVITCHDLPACIVDDEPPPPAPAIVTSAGETLFRRIVASGEPFWTAVYEPFMTRDLTRQDLHDLVSKGLEHTGGSYERLLECFNLDPEERGRFMSFLRKHAPQRQLRPFSRLSASPALEAASAQTESTGGWRDGGRLTA